jgi:predicted Zn-dependent protease
MKHLRNLLCGIILAGLAVAPASCSRETNVLGRKGTHILSAEYLNSQAAAAYEGEKKNHKQCANPQHDRVVKRVAQRLIAVAERDYGDYCEGFEWEVNCFEEPKTVNAYAMPGGKIAVYTGILPVCRNEAGVAAVMGHEVSHALLRHGSERISRQLGVSAGMIAVAVGLGQSKMSDRNQQIILAGLGLGSQVGLVLPFSRKHEAESDRLGLMMMAKAGYDPSEAPEIWVRMSEQPGGQPPEFLSTHPSHGSRTAELTALQPEAQEV